MGALIAVGIGAGNLAATQASAQRAVSSTSVDVDGVTGVDASVSTGAMTVEWGDVDQARLTVDGVENAEDWTLEQRGGTLVVAPPTRWWPFSWGGESSRITLVLPDDLGRIGAEFEASAGSIVADGDFGALVVDVSAGKVSVAGSALSVTGDVSAGEAVLDLAGVSESVLQVSAGSIEASFTGATPTFVEARVSAGRIDLTLPRDTYRVSVDQSAGDVDSDLVHDPESSNIVKASVSAGDLVLREGD